MSAVIKAEPLAYAEMEKLATSIAKSGLFGIKTADQAITLMMIAHAEGRHPVEAARDYDVIQGRPAKKAEAMLRDFLSAGGTVKWHDLSDSIADATFSHPIGGSVRITWDTGRAKTAGLAGKDLWQKYPRQMLRSRTVSEGVRTVWPMATSGMYVPEEQADIPFAGKTIEAEPPAQATATTSGDIDRQSARERFNTEVSVKPFQPTNGSAEPPQSASDDAWLAPLDEPNGIQWLKNLDVLLANAQSQNEVVQIGGHHSVGAATAKAPPAVRARVSEMLANAYARFAETSDAASDEELPPIVGEERVGSGVMHHEDLVNLWNALLEMEDDDEIRIGRHFRCAASEMRTIVQESYRWRNGGYSLPLRMEAG